MKTFFVKARKTGTKKYKFLTSSGGLNPLRIHAAEFHFGDAATAETELVKMRQDNPGWEFVAKEVA